MTIQEQFYETQARTLIKNIQRRHMAADYCPTKEAALTRVLSLIPEGSSVAWGGSMSVAEVGVIDALYTNGNYTLYDRDQCPPEEREAMMRQSYFANYYLMSSNAITHDGQLINIDGSGNRVSSLIFGPDKVIMLVGMNKVCATVEDGLNRIHNVACPLNTIRLNKQTPCALTGVCGDCLAPDCICMQTVITRNSRIPDRIHVILVGESLGY